MKIMITGAGGALGEAVHAVARESGHQVFAHTHSECDIGNDATIGRLLRRDRPDVVINCAGVIDRSATAFSMIRANALGPLTLAGICYLADVPLIHISTDCVFSGSRPMHASEYNGPSGPYPSSAEPDAPYGDIYGASKAMGEIRHEIVTNVRTSFITPRHGLITWLLAAAQEGRRVEGYLSVWWSGSSAWRVAQGLVEIAKAPPGGVVHLATAQPITKFAVLQRIAESYRLPIDMIEPTWDPVLNRALVPDIELAPLDGMLSWPG